MSSGANALAKVGKIAWDSFWDSNVPKGMLQSGERGLARIGPLGETLTGLLRGYQDRYESRAGQVSEFYIPRATSIKNSGLTNEFVGDLQRKARAVNPEAKELADYSRLLNESLYQEAQQAGIKVGPRVNDDWHRMYPPELFEGVAREDTIKKLMATGQASNYREADKMLQYMQSKGGKVHTLESPRRINLPGSREDMAVMYDHFTSSLKRIEQAKVFGAKDEVLDQLLSGIRQQHGVSAYKYATLVANTFLGRGAGFSPVGDLSEVVGYKEYGRIASLEAVSKLGLAVLKHVGQPLNTVVWASRSGVTPVLRAIKDMVVDHGNAVSFALKTGATMMHVAHDFRNLAKVESESLGSKVLKYSGFNYVDKLRRVFATRVGAEMAHQEFEALLANRANTRARTSLRLLGLDPDQLLEQGHLTEQNLFKAAKITSDVTQFRTTALDLPAQWRNQPLMRMVTMYKQFAFNQARFIKEQVLKPALFEGEMRPLLYMATLFPTFGEAIADINEFAHKGNLKDRPKEITERLLDNFSHVGGFGIMHDLVYAFAQPRETAAFKFVVGPVISDAVDLATMPFQAHPIEEMEKKIVRSIPIIGPIAETKAFHHNTPPKSALQKGSITKGIKRVVRKIDEVF